LIRKSKPKPGRDDKVRYTIIALLVSVIGLAIAFASYAFPRGPAPPPPSAGSLTIGDGGVTYYPPDGKLPIRKPPDYDDTHAPSHCELWENWFNDVGAAPTSAGLYVTTLANTSSPITILDIRFEVYSRKSITGNDRIRCQYGANGLPGTTIYPNLDFPTRPIPMDIDADGSPDTTLPGGKFVVDPQGASTLTIALEGTEGHVYEYSMTIRVVENVVERRESFGSRERPLRVAFDQHGPHLQDYDWDPSRQVWIPARWPR
jgi:hypothetical protein